MEFMIRELETLSEDLASLAAIIEEDKAEAEKWHERAELAKGAGDPPPSMRGRPTEFLMKKMVYIGAKFIALQEYMMGEQR